MPFFTNRMEKLRPTVFIILFLSVVLLPHWLYLPLIGAAMVFFPLYWEGIFFALMIDVLYGGGVGTNSWMLSPMAFAATLILIALLPVRERLRVYA